jgi:hypothetical protein
VSKASQIRRSRRVIRMVSELHRMGFQRLRFMPYLRECLAYRVLVAPVSCFSVANGCHAKSEFPGVTYSSASENEYFGWTDATSDDAHKLAVKFVDRFPEIAGYGSGRDWAYAGWLLELLGAMEKYPNRLPDVFSEKPGESTETMRFLPLDFHGEQDDPSDSADRVVAVPLPPPGENV